MNATDWTTYYTSSDQTWDTAALQRDFMVQGFAAPLVIVVRKADSVRGTLTFTHSPRVYRDFIPE